MRRDGREGERTSSGKATAQSLGGWTAVRLDETASTSSVFALQQVLQRDDGEAIGRALGHLSARVAAKDQGATAVLEAWVASSPKLAELSRARGLAAKKRDNERFSSVWS